MLELCSPSLTIRKLAQSAGRRQLPARPGLGRHGHPDRAGRHVRLGAADRRDRALVDADHRRQRVRPVPVGTDARPSELHALGSPRRCSPTTLPAGRTATTSAANSRTPTATPGSSPASSTGGDHPSFTLTPIGQEIVTCTLWNSFDYEPAIALTKVNTPTEVRGDLTPPRPVTVDLRGDQPRQHAAEQRHRDRRQVRAGDPGAAAGPTSATRTQTAGSTRARSGRSPVHARAASVGDRPPPVGQRRQHREVMGIDPAGTIVSDDRHRRRRGVHPGDRADQAGERPATIGHRGQRHRGDLHLPVANTGNTPLGAGHAGRRHPALQRSDPRRRRTRQRRRDPGRRRDLDLHLHRDADRAPW